MLAELPNPSKTANYKIPDASQEPVFPAPSRHDMRIGDAVAGQHNALLQQPIRSPEGHGLLKSLQQPFFLVAHGLTCACTGAIQESAGRAVAE